MTESIREVLSALLDEIIEVVTNRLSEVPVRLEEKVRIERGPDGTRQLKTAQATQRWYVSFLTQNQGGIESLPSYASFSNELKKAPEFTQALRLPDQESTLTDSFFHAYLLPLCAAALESLDAGMERSASVEKVVRQLDGFARSESLVAKYAAPLWNVECQGDEMQITNGVWIRRIQDDDLAAHISGMRFARSPMEIHHYLRLDFQLYSEVPQQRTDASPIPHGVPIQELFERVVKALRLAKHGALGMAFLRARLVSLLGEGVGWTVFPGGDAPTGDGYVLTGDDVKAAAGIVSHVTALDGDARFSLAMRRFMDAYHRHSLPDRLVDFWVGLETLLLPDGGEGEMRFRAATRLAFLLGDRQTRMDIFRRAKKSYHVRSKIVHGTEMGMDPELLKDTEEFLRGALRRCLQLRRVPSGEWLDSLMLDS
jgi:hypothetical protein